MAPTLWGAAGLPVCGGEACNRAGESGGVDTASRRTAWFRSASVTTESARHELNGSHCEELSSCVMSSMLLLDCTFAMSAICMVLSSASRAKLSFSTTPSSALICIVATPPCCGRMGGR